MERVGRRAWSRSNSSTSLGDDCEERSAALLIFSPGFTTMSLVTAHMRANGFELQNRFVVQQRDTFDLIYVPKRDFVEALPQGGVQCGDVDAVWAAVHSVYVARRSYSYA